MKTLTMIENQLFISKVTCQQLITLQRQYEARYTRYPFFVADTVITAFYEKAKDKDNIYLLLTDGKINYPDDVEIIKNLSLFGVTDYRQVSEWFMGASTMPDSIEEDEDYRTHFISCFGHEEHINSENLVYFHVIYEDEGEVAFVINSHLRTTIIDEILKDLQ